MVVAVKEGRPSYVQFEVQLVEDRTASIEQGHYVAKEVHFAILTPQGSKDRIPRIASEWLEQLDRDARDDRIPREWVEFYRRSYESWKRGQEIPVEGTPVRNWPFPSPAQVAMLIDLNMRTVEDVAAANEEAIRRMGMGGLSLKQAAEAFLGSAAGSGKLIKELDALRADNAAMKTRNESLEAQVLELASQVRALQPAGQQMKAL